MGHHNLGRKVLAHVTSRILHGIFKMRPETAEALVVRTTAFLNASVLRTAASVGNAPNGIFHSAGLSARGSPLDWYQLRGTVSITFDSSVSYKAFVHEIGLAPWTSSFSFLQAANVGGCNFPFKSCVLAS